MKQHKTYENYNPRQFADQKINYALNLPKTIALRDQPCMDCQLTWHPSVMTFDHRDRSTKNIATSGKRLQPMKMLSFPPAAFDAMLANCDVVCTNCHKLREFIRDGKLVKDHFVSLLRRTGPGALLKRTTQRDGPRGA